AEERTATSAPDAARLVYAATRASASAGSRGARRRPSLIFRASRRAPWGSAAATSAAADSRPSAARCERYAVAVRHTASGTGKPARARWPGVAALGPTDSAGAAAASPSEPRSPSVYG